MSGDDVLGPGYRRSDQTEWEEVLAAAVADLAAAFAEAIANAIVSGSDERPAWDCADGAHRLIDQPEVFFYDGDWIVAEEGDTDAARVVGNVIIKLAASSAAAWSVGDDLEAGIWARAAWRLLANATFTDRDNGDAA